MKKSVTACILLVFLAAYFLAACRTTFTNPATATARAQRVIAQATDIARQLRETTLLDEKQATATAQDRLDRLARLSTWPVVLSDAFDDNASGWVLGQQTGEYADVNFTIDNGVYLWEATPHQGFIWWNNPSISPVTDFYMTTEYRQLSGPQGTYVGLIMGLNENDDFYLFSLRRSGDFALEQYYTGQWFTLISWSPAPVFHEDETNLLEVFAEQGLLSLFVNGVWVADYADQTIPSGLCGLAGGINDAGESAAWEFDNFEVRAISTEEEIHTPEATARP